jgi:hypothetical protein
MPDRPEHSASFRQPGLIPHGPEPTSEEGKIIAAAIERGTMTGRKLVAARDALFDPMREIVRIAGRDGLMACSLGVQMAVLREMEGGK